jgi:hypothetical protein
MLIKYQNYPYITVLLFDLAISNQAQVRKALNNQAKVGLTAGIYFWINQLQRLFP